MNIGYLRRFVLPRAKYVSFPISFLKASIACLMANSAEQLIHKGGSPQAVETKYMFAYKVY